MPRVNPFDLPDDVVDAATARLGDLPAAGREQALHELLERFPQHAEALRNFVHAIGAADRVLGATFRPTPLEPPQFEGYRVVRRLGEGAFGVVYLAEQLTPIQRTVAIKLLRPGVGDRNTLARFEAERRFLARLQHPAIAQIFDAGSLPDGRPWFVMEHVDGVPLAAFCDRERLAIDARLRLFVRVCQGVQYAHEQGIVHRDLKPSNVLVVEIDGEPRPKVIDFGIARALQLPTDPATPRTETGRVVGTPGYMSPEQAEGRMGEIDVRSDVWSLGAMLYELLTGTLPLGSRPTTTDTDPERPSRRLTADPGRLTEIAGQRGTDARRLAARVRGDLDWIVGRALARDRALRYPSVHELAADVLRHLQGEAVHAGPPSFAYRLRKFARRHRIGVAVAGSAAVLLTIGSFVFAALQARAAANFEQAEAAVQALLSRANDPQLIRSASGAATRRVLAEDALAFYERWWDTRPQDAAAAAGRASCLSTLSQVHWLLGNSAAAEQVARLAVAAFDELLTAPAPDAGMLRRAGLAQWRLARVLGERAAPAQFVPVVRRAVALLEQALAQRAPDTLPLLVDALHLLGTSRGDLAALTRAAELQRQWCAADPQAVARRARLGALLAVHAHQAIANGDRQAAGPLLQEAEALEAQHAFDFGERHYLRAAQAYFAVEQGPAELLVRSQRCVDAAQEWIAAEPHRSAAHDSLAGAWRMLAAAQQMAGGEWHASAEQAMAVATAWREAFPTMPAARFALAMAALPLGQEGVAAGRRAALPAPLAAVRRACAALAPCAELPEPRRSQEAWEIEGLLGILADGVDAPDRDDVWAACTRSLLLAFGDAPVQMPGFPIDLGNRITQRLLAAGQLPEARAWLDRLAVWQRATGAPLFASPGSLETVRLRVAAAVRAGDWPPAEQLVESLAAANCGWRGLVAAADAACLLADAAAAAKHDAAAAMRERAVDHTDVALEALQSLVASQPDDLWLQEPLLRLRLQRLLLVAANGDASHATDVTAAIADYEALAAVVPADLRRDDLLLACRRLFGR